MNNNIKTYENFNNEYSKLVHDYKSFKKTNQKLKADLWYKNKAAIKDILSEIRLKYLSDNKNSLNLFDELSDGKNSIDRIFIDYEDNYKSNPIYTFNIGINENEIKDFVLDLSECMSKFGIVSSDFELECNFEMVGKYKMHNPFEVRSSDGFNSNDLIELINDKIKNTHSEVFKSIQIRMYLNVVS